jgi:hypothetical protein
MHRARATSGTAEDRARLLQMAQAWRDLADKLSSKDVKRE